MAMARICKGYGMFPCVAMAAGRRIMSSAASAGLMSREEAYKRLSPDKAPRGCDYEHWLVGVEDPPEDFSRDDIINSYIQTLSKVVSSEQEARMKIYSVSTKYYFGFGALVSEELADKLKELPGVRMVLPDAYFNHKTKEYLGEPFINGKAVPYSSDYHPMHTRPRYTTFYPHPKYRKRKQKQDA